ncbi:discoidin domain-containing protein [Micromonospora sp. HNM0581]|uniref:discoidin domain-containing protein n=1 Tax=Micromonospora sp. HNM0581 TaxID=2716341 RepID=UPI00146AC604|nr:discoidin domain-containing protein [Micromonospora sp. HNM0581]NLU79476.1 discoidin domain-containing protein [Micromonospora sp. HNM0581]
MTVPGPSDDRTAGGQPTQERTTEWLAAFTPGGQPAPVEPDPRRDRRTLSVPLRAAVAAAVLIAVGGGAYLVGGDRERPAGPARDATAREADPVAAEPFVVETTASPVPTPSISATTASAAPSSAASRPTTATPTVKPAGTPTGRANPTRRNLALGRPVVASTVEGPAWSPEHAVDGDPLTRWSSAFADPQWIAVDLGDEWRLTEVRLVWERAHATRYSVLTSRDGRSWSTIHTTSVGTEGPVRIDAGSSVARYVRVSGLRRSGHYGYSLIEFEVR